MWVVVRAMWVVVRAMWVVVVRKDILRIGVSVGIP
jgi:hypothetical protein